MLAKSSRWFYSSDATDEKEETRRAGTVKALNDVVFMLTFILARTFCLDILLYTMHRSSLHLLFKLQSSGLYFLSYIWIWEIVNKAAKLFAVDLFPTVKIFSLVYKFFKSIRPLMPVYLLLMLWYTHRHLIAYYGVYDYFFN